MIGDKIKKSVLDTAIKGKLIENKKSLNAVVEENTYKRIPYEIPNNWRWCKIGDFLSIETGLAYSKGDQTTERENTIRVLRGGNINNQFQYILKEDDVYVKNIEKYKELQIGDILTPSVTSMEQIGKTAYIDRELPNISAGGFVYIMRSTNKEKLDPKYALYFISSEFHREMCKPNINKSGQAFYNLKKSGLVEQPIAIPPIEEQKEIVKKIEEIFYVCREISERGEV